MASFNRWFPILAEHLRCVCLLVSVTLVVGCEQSTENKFLQMAKDRAARNAAEKEENELAPEPAPPPAPTPVAEVAATAEKVPATAAQEAVPAPVPEGRVTVDAPPTIEVDNAGRMLTFDRGDGTIGLFDLDKKQLLKSVGTQDFLPYRFALDPGGRQLFVADRSGRVAEYDVDPSVGLDEFARRRRRSQSEVVPRQAHDRAVTAITTVGYGGSYATADDQGEIRIWGPSPNLQRSVEIDDGEIVELERFGGGRFLFAAIRKGNAGNVAFWKLEDGTPIGDSLREHVKLQGYPTRMVQLASGGGLGVGDSTGKIRLWLPSDGKVVPSELKPFNAPVSGLALVSGGTTVVAADERGNVRMFRLPIAERRNIELPAIQSELIDVDTQAETLHVANAGGIDVLPLSPKGSRQKLSLGGDKNIVDAVTLSGTVTKLVAAATSAGTIEFFDSATGRVIGSTLVGGTKPIVEVSNDSRTIIYASDAGEFGRIAPPSESMALASSAGASLYATDELRDLAVVLTSESRLARIYDTSSGRVIGSTSLASIEGEVSAISIQDAVVLLGTTRGGLWIWQGDQIKSRPVEIVTIENNEPIIAINVGEEGTVRIADRAGHLWNADLKKASDSIAATSIVQKFDREASHVSLGRSAFAAAKGNAISLMADGSPSPLQYLMPQGNVSVLAIAPRSVESIIVSDKGECWVADKSGIGNPLSLPSSFVARGACWSKDGRFLLVSDGKQLLVFEKETRRLIAEHLEPAGVGKIDTTANGGCLFADSQGMVRRRSLAIPTWQVIDPIVVTDFSFSQDGANVLAVTETGQLWKIEEATGSISEVHQVSSQSLSSIDSFESGLVLALETDSGRLIDCTDAKSPSDWRSGKFRDVSRIVRFNRQSLVACLRIGGELVVLDTAQDMSEPKKIAIEGGIENFAFVDASTLAIKLKDKGAISVIPIHADGTTLGKNFSRVADIVALAGIATVAVADGTETVSVFDLQSNDSKDLQGPRGIGIDRLYASPTGTHLAARTLVSGQPSNANSVLIWNLEAPNTTVVRVDLDSRPTTIAFSNDNTRLYVGCQDKSVRAFLSAGGVELERAKTLGVPLSIEVMAENTLWVGSDSAKLEPVVFRLENRLTSEPSEVKILEALPGQLLLSASDSRLSVHSLAQGPSEKVDPITLTREAKDILAATIRADGKAVAASFGGEKPRIDIWRFGEEPLWGKEIEPSITLPMVNASDAIEFISDSKLVVGQRSGLIQLIDLLNQKPAYNFVGHQSPVAALALTNNGNQLLSCSGDRSVRRWSLPSGAMAGTDGVIPESAVSTAVDLNSITEQPLGAEEPIIEEDAFAEVRNALMTGSGVSSEAQVFSLFEDDQRQTDSVAEKYRKIKQLEESIESADGDASDAIAQLAKARKDFYDQRKELASLKRVSGGNTFADNQPNLLFNTQTRFNFSAGVRTVETKISDGRFVYAAMPSSAQQPGKLFVWDFGVSGVLTHAWDQLTLNMREMIGLPDGRGVLTMPDLRVFSQDGTSRQIAEALHYAVSSKHTSYGPNRLFAIANRGVASKEAALLQVFRDEDLMQPSAQPVSTLSAFESEVTAMTFANTHRAVAFSIRERTGYRLLLADPQTLEPRSITLVEEGRFNKPWLVIQDESSQSREQGQPGPITLEFSPDDRMLVVHSQVSEERYEYSVYRIDWPSGALPSSSQITRFVGPVSSEGPFFDTSSSRALFFVTKTYSPADKLKWNMDYASSSLIAFKKAGELQVVNCVTGATTRKFPLLTSNGVPRYSVTKDGQWAVTADDRGYVKIGNLATGKSYDLTPDGRPAHAGPVVGVAISDTDSSLQLPEYVVTVGEENRLKVWDVLSRLK